MSNQETFNDLFSCIKILERNQLTIPSVGFQRKYNLTKEFLEDEKFGLIINRKGHLNAENLTYIMSSKTYGGILVRLDISGAVCGKINVHTIAAQKYTTPQAA